MRSDADLHEPLNLSHLLGHHREDLDVDPVELIKASPGPTLSQPAEEFAHELVVEVLATIEHNALNAQGLAQVLGGLSLAGA